MSEMTTFNISWPLCNPAFILLSNKIKEETQGDPIFEHDNLVICDSLGSYRVPISKCHINIQEYKLK